MMLMTYTSPELIPTPAESVKHVGLPAGSRHLEPDRQSRQSREDRREDTKDIFELQFSHSRRLLLFVARRILNCAQEAEEAVKNCRLTASCNPPAFSSEGAFKSWLVRILIDEATLMLRKRQNDSTPSPQPLPEGL
jgi:DNA-directed RNA polymerase specialized sigma24 family protein